MRNVNESRWFESCGVKQKEKHKTCRYHTWIQIYVHGMSSVDVKAHLCYFHPSYVYHELCIQWIFDNVYHSIF